MKGILGFFSLLVPSFILISPAWTAPTKLNAFTVQSVVERVQSCRAGTYWCPGQISGCCPNGYGCGSTHCIKPRASTPTVRTPSQPSVNAPRVSPPTVRTTTPSVRTPTITGGTPAVPSPTVRTHTKTTPTVNVKTPRVPRNDTGVCPSLKGLASEMGGLLGC